MKCYACGKLVRLSIHEVTSSIADRLRAIFPEIVPHLMAALSTQPGKFATNAAKPDTSPETARLLRQTASQPRRRPQLPSHLQQKKLRRRLCQLWLQLSQRHSSNIFHPRIQPTSHPFPCSIFNMTHLTPIGSFGFRKILNVLTGYFSFSSISQPHATRWAFSSSTS